MKWLKYNADCEISVMDAMVYISMIYAKPDRCHVHAHHHSFLEMHFQQEGLMEFVLDFNETVRVLPGEWILLGKDVYHEENVSEQCSGYIIRLEIRSAEKPSPFEEWKNSAWIKGEIDPEVQKLIRWVFEEADEENPGAYDMVRSLCTVLLIHLIRQISASDSLRSRKRSHSSDDRTILDEYFDGIFRQDGRQLSIGELAGMMRFSTRQVSRILQQEYGMTFSQKLNVTRTKLAEHLLLHTDLSVRQIAGQCGVSAAYLNRCFRDQFGMSPMQFRKERKTENETDKIV